MADDARSNGILGSLASLANKPTTRRDFLKMAGAAGVGVAALGGLSVVSSGCDVKGSTSNAVTNAVFVANAKMMVVHDGARCVGCKRCEVACSLFHDNKIQPSIARVKISRNFNFGPTGPRIGTVRGEGLFGNYRMVGETCLQCPHPVPCMTACPQQAIGVDASTGARVIDANKCIGCQVCLKACPWAMTSYDAEVKKATKCDLCGGDPQCVKICPAGALSYVPWRDRSKDTPIRQTVPAYITAPASVQQTCDDCHKTTASVAAK